MKYFTTDLDGVTLIEPDSKEQREILESVINSTEDYPEVFLTHDSGITIGFRNGGYLVREENEEVQGIIESASLETALEVWKILASGNLEELDTLPWSERA